MIIFVDSNGTERAPMAAEIYKNYRRAKDEVCAKGLVVAFSEPVNPKVAAVLASDGIDMADYSSSRLSEDDFKEGTLVFAIDERIRDGIIANFDKANEGNTFDICGYVGEELAIMDPYGGTLTTYGICYESIKNVIKKVIETMEEKNE